MELNNILLDAKTSVEGVWLSYEADFEVCVASSHTKEYDAAQTKIIAPFIPAIREGVMPDGLEDELEMKLLASYCVRDWRGLTSGGVPVPYSAEKCIELFKHPGGFRFMKWVRSVSGNAAKYRAANLSDIKGN
jgi:hypothetical protein